MNVLVDTGVWIAVCDQRERPDERESLDALMDGFVFSRVLLPWPVVYETIRTRISRKPAALVRLESLLKRSNIVFLDDSRYRADAFELVFDQSIRKRPPRPLSMVDCLLRLLLDDPDLKIDQFATYNIGDFHDVCATRLIEMVS